MTYEERTAIIGTILREEVLKRFKRPEHLGDAEARGELADMVDELNANWPLGTDEQMRAVGERFATAVKRNHDSRQWPTIKKIVGYLKDALKGAPVSFSAAEICPFEINAARIKAGQPVGEDWLYGPGAHELIRRGLVSDADMAPRRSGLFFDAKSVWGEDVALAHEARLRAIHDTSRAWESPDRSEAIRAQPRFNRMPKD